MNRLINFRKYRNIYFYTMLFLTLFTGKPYSQSSLSTSYTISSDSIRSASLFSVQNHTTNSTISIIKNEPGELLQTSQLVENNLINVTLAYQRSVPPNPLKLASFYNIRLQSDGSTEIEMREAIPLELMTVNNNLSIMYEGSHLIYPKIIHVNDTLASASGKFFFKRKLENTNFLTYEVSLRNRQISRKEIINVNGQELEAYIHTYSIKIDVKFENLDYLSRTEEVQEWLVPKYGIIKQERTGNEFNHANAVNKNLECFRKQLVKSLNITK